MSRSAKPRTWETVDEYLARGGEITIIPRGVSGENFTRKLTRKQALAEGKRQMARMTGAGRECQ